MRTLAAGAVLLFLLTVWLGTRGLFDMRPPIVKVERPLVMPCGGGQVGVPFQSR